MHPDIKFESILSILEMKANHPIFKETSVWDEEAFQEWTDTSWPLFIGGTNGMTSFQTSISPIQSRFVIICRGIV